MAQGQSSAKTPPSCWHPECRGGYMQMSDGRGKPCPICEVATFQSLGIRLEGGNFLSYRPLCRPKRGKSPSKKESDDTSESE